MKNQSQSTKVERRQLAEQGITKSLLGLGLNGAVLKEFFGSVYWKLMDVNTGLIESVEGGVCKFGTVGGCQKQLMRSQTGAIQYMVGGMFGTENYIESWPGILPTYAIIRGKKFQEHRIVLTVSLIYMTGLDESFMEPAHLQYFRRLVSFWRNELEVMRVTLHLRGEPAYTPDIQQVNLFLKVLETI